RADIWMLSETSERAGELLMVLAAIGDGAAGFVNERDDAVDVGELGENLFREILGDVFRRRGGTVHGADDADVIARGGAAVGAAISHKCAAGDGSRFRWDFAAEGMFESQLPGFNVVRVNPASGGNRLRGIADCLAELAQRLAFIDGPQRDLVAHIDPL